MDLQIPDDCGVMTYRGYEIAPDCCPPTGCGMSNWVFRRIGSGDAVEGAAPSLAGARREIDARVANETEVS
jgi:hypothetical protein